MPSLQATLINGYIRMRMKPKRLHEMDPAALRDWTERNALAFPPKDVRSEEVEAGAVRGAWRRPPDAREGAAVLYLHGGGYVFGSPRLYRGLTSALAKAARTDVFSATYRLAPEHPCPAAIDDALAAWDWLVASGVAPAKIAVGGDSAGGGLTLALLLALKARGGPMPAAAFLYSPWTDLAATGATVRSNAKSDIMFHRDSVLQGASRYAGGLDRRDPRCSPLYGDLAGLPPLLVFASRSEMLFDDAARLVEKARGCGVSVDFEPHDGLVHVWPLFWPLMPESKAAVERTAQFICTRTA